MSEDRHVTQHQASDSNEYNSWTVGGRGRFSPPAVCFRHIYASLSGGCLHSELLDLESPNPFHWSVRATYLGLVYLGKHGIFRQERGRDGETALTRHPVTDNVMHVPLCNQ